MIIMTLAVADHFELSLVLAFPLVLAVGFSYEPNTASGGVKKIALLPKLVRAPVFWVLTSYALYLSMLAGRTWQVVVLGIIVSMWLNAFFRMLGQKALLRLPD